MGLFSKKSKTVDPIADAVSAKLKAEVQKGLISTFSRADRHPPAPEPENIALAVERAIQSLPRHLEQAIEINNSMVFIKAGDSGERGDVFVAHILPALRKKLKELGISHGVYGDDSVTISLNELRKFCRYDKLKSMT